MSHALQHFLYFLAGFVIGGPAFFLAFIFWAEVEDRKSGRH